MGSKNTKQKTGGQTKLRADKPVKQDIVLETKPGVDGDKQLAPEENTSPRSGKKGKLTKEEKKEQRIQRRNERRGEGLRLAKWWHRGFASVLFSRFSLVVILLCFQALFTLIFFDLLQFIAAGLIMDTGTYLMLLELIQLIILIYIINSPMDSTAKVPWVLLVAIFPYFGMLFYVWTRIEMGHRKVKRNLNKLYELPVCKPPQNMDSLDRLKEADADSAALAHYLYDRQKAPVYENTSVEYYPLGEYKFEKMLEELEKAEKFIFLEYFIIAEGYMWGNIVKILAEKAAQGVDVRVMYDGTCEISTLPAYYPRRLRKLGIKCKVWERIKPVVTSSYNYRDHRKILVIDGKVAFNGGVNLADEYINKEVRFGHWKDTAIMLKGPAVDNFTLMFLQMWNVHSPFLEDFSQYLNKYDRDIKAEGFVIPYAESPLNDHKAAERVYADILYTARDYVYIMSPYLILDDELNTALRFAAQRGVDVRLIIPGIPDKKAPYALAKMHYKSLVKAGVKVYEYTPGFVHAKVFVSDDKKAVVGTINLDYRSLYHHFECATYMVNVPCISDILKDYNETVAMCKPVTMDTIKHEKLRVKLLGAIMKIIAPML